MSTILAVDDAAFILSLIKDDLEENAYTVFTADCGEKALSVLDEQAVDLVLLDYYMPGLSGLETLQAIKADARFQNTAVIMLSGAEKEAEIIASLNAGAADFMIKPYITQLFLARIKNVLSANSA